MAVRPETRVLLPGELIVATGGVASDTAGIATRAANTARPALRRPAPKLVSHPGVPRSSAVCLRMFWTSAGVSAGFTDSIKAATPATIGAEAEVPLKLP